MDVCVFTCKICGKEHPSTAVDMPNFTTEEIVKRQLAWLKAEDKFSEFPNNEHFERDAQKTWNSYMETKSNVVFKFPTTTATTTRNSKGEWYILCADHEQVKEKATKTPKP